MTLGYSFLGVFRVGTHFHTCVLYVPKTLSLSSLILLYAFPCCVLPYKKISPIRVVVCALNVESVADVVPERMYPLSIHDTKLFFLFVPASLAIDDHNHALIMN